MEGRLGPARPWLCFMLSMYEEGVPRQQACGQGRGPLGPAGSAGWHLTCCSQTHRQQPTSDLAALCWSHRLESCAGSTKHTACLGRLEGGRRNMALQGSCMLLKASCAALPTEQPRHHWAPQIPLAPKVPGIKQQNRLSWLHHPAKRFFLPCAGATRAASTAWRIVSSSALPSCSAWPGRSPWATPPCCTTWTHV